MDYKPKYKWTTIKLLEDNTAENWGGLQFGDEILDIRF